MHGVWRAFVRKQNGDFKNELDVRMDFSVCGYATVCISHVLFYIRIQLTNLFF
jgi:hypothetical protein